MFFKLFILFIDLLIRLSVKVMMVILIIIINLLLMTNLMAGQEIDKDNSYAKIKHYGHVVIVLIPMVLYRNSIEREEKQHQELHKRAIEDIFELALGKLLKNYSKKCFSQTKRAWVEYGNGCPKEIPPVYPPGYDTYKVNQLLALKKARNAEKT